MIGKLLAVVLGITAIVVMAGVLLDDAPATDDDSTDMIVLMGQSNATYRSIAANISTAAPWPAPGTAFYYGTALRPANFETDLSADNVMIRPLSTESGPALGDKWPSIAYEYVKATGKKVILVQCAVGGVSIRTFSPTLPGVNWTETIRMIDATKQAMIAADMTPGNVRIVWIQGEADAHMDEDQYKSRLLTVGTCALQGGLGCKVEGPFWISKTRGTGNSQAAQVALADEKPGMFRIASDLADTFTVENGLMTSDNTHYSQAGNNLLGSAIGEAVGESAKASDKMDRAIWGVIGIGVIVMVAAGILAIFRR